MKKIVYYVSLIVLCLALSSWGSKGHKKINGNMPACLPAQMSFLMPVWTGFVLNHASDADYRKDTDPDESPRHFIDIDNYPVFVQTGRIPQTYDSIIAGFGYTFVIDQGILPWATMTTFDSLRNCFQRGDWNRSAFFAADLGHYVGDGHMPLHITANYNGVMTGQTGIHSRYETTMIGKYETQIVYPADSAHYIGNVGGYVFSYLYEDYKYVDSVLLADTYATTLAGNTTSDTYYQALWEKSGPFTKLLMRNASASLADLIYTAWVQAGSPRMYPNAIDEPAFPGQPLLLTAFPNPASKSVNFPVIVTGPGDPVTLTIHNSSGNLVYTLPHRVMAAGCNNVEWNVQGLAPGIYICRLRSGNFSASQRFVVVH
jgi:hypothetical protein